MRKCESTINATCKSEHVSIVSGPLRLIGPGRVEVWAARTLKGVGLTEFETPALDLILPAASDRDPPGSRVGPTPNTTTRFEADCQVHVGPVPSVLIPS